MSETYEKIPRKERIPILNITNRTETTSDCQFYLLCVILHIYRSPAYVYCGQELVVVTCASMWNLYWYSRSYIFQSLIFSPAFSGPAFSTHAFSVPHFSVPLHIYLPNCGKCYISQRWRIYQIIRGSASRCERLLRFDQFFLVQRYIIILVKFSLRSDQ